MRATLLNFIPWPGLHVGRSCLTCTLTYGTFFLWTPTAGEAGRRVFYVSQRCRSEDRLVDLILGMVVRPSLDPPGLAL